MPRGLQRREYHWIRVRAELPVDWVPLSSVTLERFGVVRNELEDINTFGSEGKDSVASRKGFTKSKGNGG